MKQTMKQYGVSEEIVASVASRETQCLNHTYSTQMALGIHLNAHELHRWFKKPWQT